MSHTHYQEEQDAWLSRADRFDGFDRGDADWDYAEEQRAQNEADEIELRAAGLIDWAQEPDMTTNRKLTAGAWLPAYLIAAVALLILFIA